jgi:hypothetical protein
MGVTNYRINKIEGNVGKRGNASVDVKESFSITDVTKKNDKMLEVDWSFKVDYKAIGKMDLEGSLTYFTDEVTDMCEEKTIGGKKKLVLKGAALSEVSNFVLRRGIIEAIVLARTLNLPAPIQLPSVKVESKK